MIYFEYNGNNILYPIIFYRMSSFLLIFVDYLNNKVYKNAKEAMCNQLQSWFNS